MRCRCIGAGLLGNALNDIGLQDATCRKAREWRLKRLRIVLVRVGGADSASWCTCRFGKGEQVAEGHGVDWEQVLSISTPIIEEINRPDQHCGLQDISRLRNEGVKRSSRFHSGNRLHAIFAVLFSGVTCRRRAVPVIY